MNKRPFLFEESQESGSYKQWLHFGSVCVSPSNMPRFTAFHRHQSCAFVCRCGPWRRKVWQPDMKVARNLELEAGIHIGVWGLRMCPVSEVNCKLLKWCEMISSILTRTEGLECWLDWHIWQSHCSFYGVSKICPCFCNCFHELPVVCVFHGQLIDFFERWSLHLWHFLPSLRAAALSSPNHHSTGIIMVHSLYEDQKAKRFLWTS